MGRQHTDSLPEEEAEALDVSVIVATYNRSERLARMLDAMRGQSLARDRFELVIVDDASTDATAELLDREMNRDQLPLQVIRRDVNGGRAQARQDGWRAARSGLVAFTDDDCEPHPTWLERALEASRHEPGAIIQGRTEPNVADLAAMPQARLPFSRTIRVSAYDPGFPTCNILMPRRLLERVGGFDTQAFGRVHGGEDADLVWRAIESGARATFAPDALVHHAVTDLGPLGKLRVAAGWEMKAVARHPPMRRAMFFRGRFWKVSHYLLVRAALALALRRSPLVLRAWLAWPYARHLAARAHAEGGGLPFAPYYAIHDLVEVLAVARGAVRYRTPML